MCDGVCLGHRTLLKEVWLSSIPSWNLEAFLSRDAFIVHTDVWRERERGKGPERVTHRSLRQLTVSAGTHRGSLWGLHSACLTRDTQEGNGGGGDIEKRGSTISFFLVLKKECRRRSPWRIRDNDERAVQKSAGIGEDASWLAEKGFGYFLTLHFPL